MFIIKLGGSVITEKASEKGIFKHSVMDGLAESLSKSKQDFILVHGAGSFGHVLAKKYRLNEGYTDDSQKLGFSMTQTKVQELNSYVLSSLQKKGIPAISIPPHSTIVLKNHKKNKFSDKIFKKYLAQGFTPVTFGDVVLDEMLGFSICSGDLLIECLTEIFRPEKVIFVMDEDGLYTSNPKKDPHATFIDSIKIKELDDLTTKIDDHADVTMGMEGKLNTIRNISQFNTTIYLLNGNKPDRLYDVLINKNTRCSIIKR